jgi:hypothetical protein
MENGKVIADWNEAQGVPNKLVNAHPHVLETYILTSLSATT